MAAVTSLSFSALTQCSERKATTEWNSGKVDAQKLEEWAQTQNPTSLVEFSSKEGEVEGILKDIAERAGGKEAFSYSRFFAVGLFRLLELVNATKPTILEKLCVALNIDKNSVDRDLDLYRNLLSKLVQAQELLKEYVDREKKKGLNHKRLTRQSKHDWNNNINSLICCQGG